MYLQIANALEARVQDGTYGHGDKLPSETELSRELSVSRATIIKAYDLLGRRHIVTRHQGSGTRVSAPPMSRNILELTGFTNHIAQLGRVPGSELLSFREGVGGGESEAESAFSEGEALVVFHRLRLVDGEPTGTQSVAIPRDVAEACSITAEFLQRADSSLYERFASGGVVLAEAEETLTAVTATRQESRVLKTEPHAALIEVVRKSRSAQQRLVEVVQARYLGSAYLYRVRLGVNVQTGKGMVT
jgi:GntR family transcriptional regulator